MALRISTSVIAALILWTLTATVPAAWAGTLCQPIPEDGHWKNIDATTPGRITRVSIRSTCYEICNPPPGSCPRYRHNVHVWSACHPTECDWGWTEAGSPAPALGGWIYVTYPWARIPTHHVWLKTFKSDEGTDYLRVVVQYVYPAPQPGLIFDDWFLRAERVAEPIPVDPKVEPEGSQLAR